MIEAADEHHAVPRLLDGALHAAPTEDIRLCGTVAFLVAAAVDLDEARPWRERPGIHAIFKAEVGQELLSRTVVSHQQNGQAVRRIRDGAPELLYADSKTHVAAKGLLEVTLSRSSDACEQLL